VWTVADLVERLTGATVAVVNADPAIPLGAVSLPDDPASPSHVLLAIGVPTAKLAAVASERGCAVLVVRDVPPAGVIDCAVVQLAPSVSWMEVIRLLDLDAPRAAGDPITGDLFALADALAERVGGPVIIEDANFQVLSYSSFAGPTDKGRDQTILSRRMTYEWLEHLESTGDLDRLRTGDDVVDVRGGPMEARRRLITAIRTPTQFLGILWVAEGATALPDDAPAEMRQAATIAVSHLERHYLNHDAERRGRGQVVRSLLDGRGQLHRYADELGLDRTANTAVLAFAPAHEVADDDRTLDRITDHVSLCCAAFRWQSAVCRVDTTVFAIVVVPPGGTGDGVMRLGGEVVSRVIPALRTVLVGATSEVGRGLATISARRRDAEDAVGALLSSADHDVPVFVRADDVRPLVILREVLQIVGDRADFTLPGLEALAREDAARGSEYGTTLRAYLEENCSISAASRRLRIHPTTLRYRLTRIRELSGLDVDDRRVRLCCELLLAAGSIARPPG
jgi:hypothetical protein